MDTSSLFDVWKIRANHYRGAYAWDRFYERFFDGVDLADKEILDIGGGVGLASTYAIVKGASKAVLLEPESDGSSANMLDRAMHWPKTWAADLVLWHLTLPSRTLWPGQECSTSSFWRHQSII